MAESSRSGLGEFLRSRRAKVSPEAAGLALGRRRRTPGLRREEVAELAGIGVDWYVRLEQGRTVSPSGATIDALARALQLGKVEHAHLHALARNANRDAAFAREIVPDPIRRVVASLNRPAYVTGRRWDVLTWNAAAADLFDFGRLAEADRNIVTYMLTAPDARRLFGATWADEAKRIVAQFRVTHDLWIGDPAFVDLVERLSLRSPEFSTWWETHDIRSAATGRKVLNDRIRGALQFEYATFQANDDPSLKLSIYSPV